MEDHRIPPGTEAIERLEDFIVVNRLTPNIRIPSERDLCEMWGISRFTFRQAVDTLISWGVLYRVPSSGVYVAVPKKNRNMVSVDSMMDELRQQGILIKKKIISTRVIQTTKQISRKLKIPLNRTVYEIIRLRTMDSVPCMIETTYFDCQQYPDFDKHYSSRTSMNSIIENVYHKQEKVGHENISVTYASEREAELLEIEPGAPLFFTSGVIEDENGIPINYYKQLIRPDQFKFVSVIKQQK